MHDHAPPPVPASRWRCRGPLGAVGVMGSLACAVPMILAVLGVAGAATSTGMAGMNHPEPGTGPLDLLLASIALITMAFGLTRRAAAGPALLAGLTADDRLAKATTGTIRRKLINIPCRIARSARRIALHVPRAWPWQPAWSALFNRVRDPPTALVP